MLMGKMVGWNMPEGYSGEDRLVLRSGGLKHGFPQYSRINLFFFFFPSVFEADSGTIGEFSNLKSTTLRMWIKLDLQRSLRAFLRKHHF